MKFNIHLFVCGLVILSSFAFLGAMDHQGSSKMIHNDRSKKIAQKIDQIPDDGLVILESPFLSDECVVKALVGAAKRGVQVKVRVAKRAKSIQKLKKAGVDVRIIQDLHAKRVLIASGMPDENGDWPDDVQTFVFLGSDNMTLSSLSNIENMVYTKNDMDYFKQNLKLLKTPEKNKKRKLVQKTPEKRKVFRSLSSDMNQSKARRIDTLWQDQGSENSIDIASMTFDSEDVVEAIENLYDNCDKENKPKTRLILDGSALKHENLLKRAKNSDKENVSVYIFDKDDLDKAGAETSLKIQHTKTITRDLNGKKLSIVSTGNLANRSDKERNVDSYHPGDDDLFNEIRKKNDEIVAMSTEYVFS